MDFSEVKAALGIERIFWVDDAFNETDTDLEKLVFKHPGAAKEFVEFGPLIDAYRFNSEPADIAQAVRDLSKQRHKQIHDSLLQSDAAVDGGDGDELPLGIIKDACAQIGVEADDRLTFDDAIGRLGAEKLDDTVKFACIIDLKDATGPADRGLDILRQLGDIGFRGLAFILTQDATEDDESRKEADFAATVGSDGLPMTVIAKDRLKSGAAEAVDAAFAVAFKRAGLRWILRPVLSAAQSTVSESMAEVVAMLLALEPERLEHFVYRRGLDEGENELHVVERALSAHVSKRLRHHLAIDAPSIEATRLLRKLQPVEVGSAPAEAGDTLTKLRKAEMWDDGSTVNMPLSPIANGDVFILDEATQGLPKSDKIFILLGQPCDLALRPNGTRVSEVAMLVPLTPLGEKVENTEDIENGPDTNNKRPELPFELLGGRYRMAMHETAHVRLSIMDLVALRTDGRMLFEKGQSANPDLLSGAAVSFEARTAHLAELLEAAILPGKPEMLTDERYLLTMSGEGQIRHHRSARLYGKASPYKARVAWGLRRSGRVRAPYSTFMLNRVLSMLGRGAFDTDYAEPK